MGTTSNDWDNMDTPQLMFYQTWSENVNQMEENSQEHWSALTHTPPNILHTKVGDFIFIQGRSKAIDTNWCLLKNKSTCNEFVNKKYLRNTRKAPNGWVMHVHFNLGTTITDLIGDLPGFNNPIWCNQYGIEKFYLWIWLQSFIVTYDSEGDYPNDLIINIPLHPSLWMSKGGLYYHDMHHLLKKNDTHIMTNAHPL